MNRKFLILLLLPLFCCNSKIENVPDRTIISFDKYFQSFQEKNVLKVFEDIEGMGPRRASEEMILKFKDSTIINFKFGSNEIFNIVNRGIDHKDLSNDSIYSKVKAVYTIFLDLKLLSVSFDDNENKRTFTFDLKIIDTKTLPNYVYPENDFKTDKQPEKGYLLYLYDDTFMKSYVFNLVKPIVIKDNWYYYAI